MRGGKPANGTRRGRTRLRQRAGRVAGGAIRWSCSQSCERSPISVKGCSVMSCSISRRAGPGDSGHHIPTTQRFWQIPRAGRRAPAWLANPFPPSLDIGPGELDRIILECRNQIELPGASGNLQVATEMSRGWGLAAGVRVLFPHFELDTLATELSCPRTNSSPPPHGPLVPQPSLRPLR